MLVGIGNVCEHSHEWRKLSRIRTHRYVPDFYGCMQFLGGSQQHPHDIQTQIAHAHS